MPASKILLIDDHPIVRRGLCEIITREADLCVCGEAGSGDEGIAKAQETQPDLIIVDISLPDINGLDLIRQIKATNNGIRMLVASMYDETMYAERALHAGASGYINKEEAVDHLIGAIRQVLMDKVYLSEDMTARVLERARKGGQLDESPMESLTDRELEVFCLFGQGLTTKQISERLHRSVKTIESHRDNIKAKLHLETSTEITHRATLWVLESRQ